MSSVSISLTPGYQFSPGELLDYAKLNALGQPSLQLQGSLGTAQIEDQAVTTAKLADGAVIATKCQAGGFTADGTGTAPFAAGWVNAMFLQQKTMPLQGRTNCIVTNNVGTPTTKATITADELVLKDGSGNVYVATAVNLTVDITAAGASNGLDTLPGTGAAVSTWYYFWVIWNGTTVQGLISTSATAPALPTGYTYQALVGAVYNNSSSQFNSFRVVNRRVYQAEAVLFTAFAATASWASYTTNVAAAIPPIARAMHGTLGTTAAYGVGLAGDLNGVGACYCAGAAGSAVDSFVTAAQFSIPIITSQTIFVKAAGTTAYCRAICTGFDF